MDLHPENVLVSEEGEVSIIDFGWCMSRNFDMEKDELEFFRRLFQKEFRPSSFYRISGFL